MMTLEDYQKISRSFACYPSLGSNISYPALGLAGETGEVCEKIKKIFRDDKGIITEEKKTAVINEIGDVLWYVAALCSEFNISLEDAARCNIYKLEDRKRRGVIGGSGDNR